MMQDAKIKPGRCLISHSSLVKVLWTWPYLFSC